MVNVPTYVDYSGFDENSTYPCNTQFMVYNPMLHMYFLTEEALNWYGIDVERKYISSNQNKTLEFIELVSKKIYDYIWYKSGMANIQVQKYRIATSENGVCLDKYSFRKQFEGVLVAEARWLIENGDSAKYSGQNLMMGKENGIKPEESWRNNSDIADEAKRSLDGLGLTRWFTLAPNIRLDINKY